MKAHHHASLVTGITVFTVNMTENIFHYSVGTSNGNGKFEMRMPTAPELGKMMATSIIAALIVGLVVKHID